MALLTCPDCHGSVSDSAPACVHCGRPMRPSAPEPPVAQPAHGPVALGQCAVCGSSDVRRLPVVYEEGTSSTRITAVTRPAGVFHQGDVSRQTQTTSTVRTESDLARRIAPPRALDEYSYGRMAGGCGGLLVLTILMFALGGPLGFLALIAEIVWMVWAYNRSRVFIDPQKARWNADELPRLRAAWERSLLCMRCGAVTDPAAPRAG